MDWHETSRLSVTHVIMSFPSFPTYKTHFATDQRQDVILAVLHTLSTGKVLEQP